MLPSTSQAMAWPICLVAMLACTERKAEPTVILRPSEIDAGRAVQDAHVRDAYVRPAEPVLPPADDQITLALGAEAEYRFTVAAQLGRMDVHFSVDTTQSISSEIDQLQRSLQHEVVETLEERVDDVAFGVSRFEDFPAPPFGEGDALNGSPGLSGDDTPFALLSPITTDRSRLLRALHELDSPLGRGGDSREASAEALWQIATGQGYRLNGRDIVEPFSARKQRAAGALGGVGFRDGALRVVVHITDAPPHHPGDYGDAFPDTHSLADAIEALKGVGARVIGIASDDDCDGCEVAALSPARPHLEAVAHATSAILRDHAGTRCPTGVDGNDVPRYDDACPLVFGVNDSGDGLSEAVTDAITALLDGIRFDEIHALASDDPIGFVRHVEASLEDTEVAPPAAPPQVLDIRPESDPDGIAETFVDVHNHTTLGFRVVLRNDAIASTDVPQSFRLVVTALGDGLVVEERVVRVLVPARSQDAGQLDDEDAG